jgi:hypothetical protein
MSVIKICPPPSELCVIRTNIHCPEEGCKGIFKNTANLDMHLSKHHKKKDVLRKDVGVCCQYHCPVEECPYNLSSGQFFKRLKYLKQVNIFSRNHYQHDPTVTTFSGLDTFVIETE